MKSSPLFRALSGFALLLAACIPSVPPSPTIDVNAVSTSAFATVYAAFTQTGLTPGGPPTLIPPPTAIRTPPALPSVFQPTGLNPLDTPHTYLSDACQYLKAKWDPNNAVPGTVVMIIMFHSIEKATQSSSDPKNIGSGDFKELMNNLHEMGFQAINTTQLADFLDSNAKIPARSVVLIQDDRHSASNFNDWFRPYWEQWGWPVVTGWISAQGSSDPVLAENVALEQEGWVDHQAHGLIHNINMTDASSDEFIRGELQGSIDAFQQFYGKTPIGIIWPGGGFGTRPVQIARELGYRVGFTTHPRGPVLFNWVPLADENDAGRPFFVAENYVNDPRLVLPRYWPTQVIANLDTVRTIGEQAAAYAQQNKAVELEYYDIVCAPAFGEIPLTP